MRLCENGQLGGFSPCTVGGTPTLAALCSFFQDQPNSCGSVAGGVNYEWIQTGMVNSSSWAGAARRGEQRHIATYGLRNGMPREARATAANLLADQPRSKQLTEVYSSTAMLQPPAGTHLDDDDERDLLQYPRFEAVIRKAVLAGRAAATASGQPHRRFSFALTSNCTTHLVALVPVFTNGGELNALYLFNSINNLFDNAGSYCIELTLQTGNDLVYAITVEPYSDDGNLLGRASALCKTEIGVFLCLDPSGDTHACTEKLKWQMDWRRAHKTNFDRSRTCRGCICAGGGCQGCCVCWSAAAPLPSSGGAGTAAAGAGAAAAGAAAAGPAAAGGGSSRRTAAAEG